MSRVIRLQLLLSLVGAIVVGALISTRAYSAEGETVPDVGGAYVEAITGQPKFLNPLLAATTDYAAQSIDALIFAGLVKEDEAGQPRPDLAESWIISPDGRQYTFYLRPNARWHDGQPVTAEDVIYTVSVMQAGDFPGIDVIAPMIPLGRAGTPADIAAACSYLCAEDSYITGQLLAVNGGMYI